MFDYYTIADSEQIRFYQLPKELVKNEKFKILSGDAKILYALLRDRVSLSTKNNWVDELGRVYIIFTLAEIMDDLGCADQKATKSMKELQKMGLVESVRRGLGKPNIIYVKNFATGLKNIGDGQQTRIPTQSRENHESGLVKITNQDSLESRIRTRENHEQSILILNELDFNDIESESMSDSAPSDKKTDTTLTTDVDAPVNNILEMKKGLTQTPTDQSTGTQSPVATSDDKYTVYRDIIQENIEYQYFAFNRPTDIEMVDELVNCMLDVILTDGEKVKINREQKSRALVKSQYLKINSQDVEHILTKFREQRHKITHVHNYLKTMLYVVKQEAISGVENAVRVDGLVW